MWMLVLIWMGNRMVWVMQEGNWLRKGDESVECFGRLKSGRFKRTTMWTLDKMKWRRVGRR
jgi:hypothetical protein